MRTSHSHPLQIAGIEAVPGGGLLGITLCPGKVQAGGLTGAWNRDLALDLNEVETWNAASVVTLVEAHDLERLKVPQLGEAVRERHMEWHHLPIRDRDVPDAAFEAEWAAVGEALRDQLRSGFNVLVHCMGGLGRAGMIASRLLVEMGWAPGEAAAEVRRVRPGAIETDEQMDHVFGCIAVPEHVPDTSVDAIRSRTIGSLLGLAVGDALGTTLEFTQRDSRPRLTDIEGGGPFGLEPGQWTDDTSMALALGDSLLACNGLNAHDLMTRFVAWWQEGAYSSTGSCFDIGMTVRAALSRFRQTDDPIAGSTDPMSAGNGSLMRLAPVAIRYWDDPDALVDAAARQSRTTHGAPEAVDACVVYAQILADAIAGRPRSEVLRSREEPYAGAIADIVAGSWRGRRREDIRASGYVAHSLEAALWCVGRTGSFAEAVLLAANLGEDADTTAAIVGQLAGALYGHKAIPRHWLGKLHGQGLIYGMATSLVDATSARKEPPPWPG
jgi:ADP-ribosyl-[dinitrogen reductase] hydrolase